MDWTCTSEQARQKSNMHREAGLQVKTNDRHLAGLEMHSRAHMHDSKSLSGHGRTHESCATNTKRPSDDICLACCIYGPLKLVDSFVRGGVLQQQLLVYTNNACPALAAYAAALP